jgi:DNA mismatch endonuclease (patch repair protein)
MADTRTPAKRSQIMAAVRQRNTGPELILRRLLFNAGYRYRLHRRDLPGTPDLAFVTAKKAVFVHGCFWHGHGCRKGQLPKSRQDYWGPKVRRNKERDVENVADLATRGWRSLIVWQCELREPTKVLKTISRFLGNG